MEKFISVIIPNYNGSSTIGKCLEAAFASSYGRFEVIVVDDCSSDNSPAIIKQFPCRIIELKTHAGAGKARNTGALHSRGEVLFFTDADCLLSTDSLSAVNKAVGEAGSDAVIGGTYTQMPCDTAFSASSSLFSSITRKPGTSADPIISLLMQWQFPLKPSGNQAGSEKTSCPFWKTWISATG